MKDDWTLPHRNQLLSEVPFENSKVLNHISERGRLVLKLEEYGEGIHDI